VWQLRLPETKSGVCVSTVSIVCTIDAYSFGTDRDVLIQSGPIMAGATDGADGMFGTRAHADHSRSCSAFARECHLDAQRPQECLRPPQSAGERSRRFWPTGASPPNLVTGKIGCT
jgi:hypothetical protein